MIITVNVGNGMEVNLDPATVDFVGRGDGKKQSIVRIGTVTLKIEEAPESLGKRVRAAIKQAGGDPKRVELEGEKSGAGKNSKVSPASGDGEGDSLPPAGEAEDDRPL